MFEEYNEVTHLSQIEQVRKRTGMWLGDVNTNEYNSAIMNMVREVVSNSVDDFMNGGVTEIAISVSLDCKTISIMDNGRGIPFGYNEEMKMSQLEMCVSVPNTGAKYEKGEGKGFKYAGGLHGAGLKCVNYMSSSFYALSKRGSEQKGISFSRGEKIEEDPPFISEDYPYEHGTWIQFTPDQEVFKVEARIKLDLLARYLKMVSYLNAGLRIKWFWNHQKHECYEPLGIQALLDEKIENQNILFPSTRVQSKNSEGNLYEIIFCIVDGLGESISPFVNGLEIEQSSDAVVVTRQSIAKAISQYINTIYNPNNRHKVVGLETSDIRSGICAVIKLLHIDPSFDSQTKTKLTNKDIGKHISETLPQLVFVELQKNPQMANKVVQHISLQAEARKASELARKKALSITRKMAQDTSNISLNIFTPPTKPLDTELNMLCMFEGLSASSALIKASKFINPETKKPYKEHIGILALQGLVLQTLEMDMSRVLQNKELATLVKVSGLNPKNPSDLSELRFGKFVITSDQDAGGAQICVQLVIFFATHFPEVIKRGMLYRLETPLFSIIEAKTKKYHFVYDSDISKALESLGVTKEDLALHKYIVRRNKGLGELDDVEVKTLVENPRLISINPSSIESLKKLLYIFSGKNNIPDRKKLLFEFGIQNERN